MTASVAAVTPTSAHRRLLAAAFARMTLPVVVRTAAFGAMLAVYQFVTGPQLKNVVFYDGDVPHKVIMTLVDGMIAAYTLLAFLAIADETIARGASRVRTYVTASIAAGLLASLLTWYWFLWIFVSRMDDPTDPWLATVLPLDVLSSLVLAAGATLIYADLRRSRESIARLQHAEIARASHVRDALGARLSAMQARVEPQFLFDTLAQVRNTYGIDRAIASRMLDGLIAYLRAAMPQLRVATSTVGREVDLAAAYVRVMTLRNGGDDRFRAAVADEVADSAMLPMVVLPLVQAAITVDARRDPAITIRANAGTGSVRLAIGARNDAFAPDTPPALLAGIRERLSAHYGSDARVELARVDETATRVTLEIPDERADRGDR